jgi:DNA (cytosine-5)-methyltransferase 1
MTDAVTFGSLFSGAGGFDLGLESATWNGIGMTCKFQVEWDKHCQQVLQHHWADVPKWQDVEQVNGAELPPVDVIAWGSPCQDLSTSGHRAGLDGTKSSMFFEGIRIIKEMREATNGKYPTVSIWENVAGAITSNNGDDFQTVLRQMAEAGCHHIEWRVLDAQWFGIPQRRRRIFVVAVWDSATIRTSGEQILAATSARAKDFDKSRSVQQGDSLRTESDTATSSRTRQVITFLSGAMIRLGGCVWHNLAPTLTAGLEKNGDNMVYLTDTKDSKPIIRRLTEIECERLMGWSDDHTRFRADGTETRSSQRYKMIGNGVAAPVAKWIGERVIEAIRTDKELEQ